MKANEIVGELYEAIDLSTAFPITKWYEDDNYATVAVARDSRKRKIEILFTPLHEEINAIDFDFTRGGTYEINHQGEAGRVFATVLKALSDYLSKYNRPDFISFGSKGESRDRKSTRLNSSHTDISRMPSSA